MKQHSGSNQLTDIRKEKIPVSSLEIGMFVCELDRPWLGTPFLLEGVLIEDETHIATLSRLCKFVYIDRTASLGEHYLAAPKKSIEIKPNTATHTEEVLSKSNLSKTLNEEKVEVKEEKLSFLNIIKEIQDYNQNISNNTIDRNDNFNFAYLSQDVEFEIEKESQELTISKQIKADLSSFIIGLKGLRQSWKRKKQEHNSAAAFTNIVNEEIKPIAGLDDTYPIIVEDKFPVEVEIATIYPVYQKTQLATEAFFNAMAQNQTVDLSSVNEALNEMVDSIERNSDALLWLSRLKKTDDYSYNHALNVSVTLMALANFMALPKKQIKDLGLAGLLQDIGKVKIPQHLLQKNEKITAEEFEIYKKHVDYTLELLEITSNISSTTMITVSQHHERIDGSGYPFKLKGKQISLAGQMAGLIDTYCALTSNRVYSKSIYHQFALEKIHAMRDKKFDGLLIDQLVQFLGMYPVSSLVELNSGEVGVVIQQNSVRRLLPKIMILLNADKTKNEYPPTINLINLPLTPSGEPYKIVRGLPPDSYGLNINNYFS